MNTLKTTHVKAALLAFALALLMSLAFAVAPASAVDLDDATADAGESTDSFLAVIDQGSLLSTSDEVSCMQRAQKLADKSGIGVYLITANSLGGATAKAYADRIYSTMDLGVGSDDSGLVLVLCPEETVLSFATYGKAENKFKTATLSEYFDDLFPYLVREDFPGLAETYYSDVEKTLTGKSTSSDAAGSVAYNGTYVTDDYGLFSDSERAALEASATSLAEQYQMGVYLLIVDNMGYQNPTSSQRTNFATSFYRENKLGLGSGKDGIMLVVAPGTRDYVTIAYGQGSYSFSDEGIAYMEDAVTDKLGDDDWVGGCTAYYDCIGEQLAYYDAKGETWEKPSLTSTLIKILAALGIPFGLARARVNREKAAMKTAREQTEAGNYVVPGSFTISRANDQFVNTTLAVTPRPKDNDSGGGGGGGWGGGGGGGFSSSGGGKF